MEAEAGKTEPTMATQARGSDKPMLAVLRGEKAIPPPIWMMRQAGRYLPEYRALRAEKGSFLNLVYDSDAAAEITLQPIRRFAFDAAILFSDILIVPYALGQDLEFIAGEGPRLSPPLAAASLDSLEPQGHRLGPIYRTVAKVRAALQPAQTLIGFAGSPWTVATYMVAGQGSREQAEARRMAYRDPSAFAAVIDRIESCTIEYLCGQAEAGAEVVQLFDSWSGSLSPDQFERWVIAPTERIVKTLRERRPDIPVIGFPKGAGEKLSAYARETGVAGVGIDETIDPVWAAKNIPREVAVQGNLDPLALLAGGEQLERSVRTVLDAFAGRPHIFNLGHGIVKETPVDHVAQMVALVKGSK